MFHHVHNVLPWYYCNKTARCLAQRAAEDVDWQLAVSSSLEASATGQRSHPEVSRDKGMEYPQGLGRDPDESPCRSRERRAIPGLERSWWHPNGARVDTQAMKPEEKDQSNTVKPR